MLWKNEDQLKTSILFFPNCVEKKSSFTVFVPCYSGERKSWDLEIHRNKLINLLKWLKPTLFFYVLHIKLRSCVLLNFMNLGRCKSISTVRILFVQNNKKKNLCDMLDLSIIFESLLFFPKWSMSVMAWP